MSQTLSIDNFLRLDASLSLDMAVSAGPLTFMDLGTSSLEVHGAKGTVETIVNVAGLDGENGFKLLGGAPYEYLGSHLAAAGDLNGDGYGDLLMSGGADGGEQIHVVLGGAGPFDKVMSVSDMAGSAISFREGLGGGDALSTGDLNGDGLLDIVIGAPRTAVNDELFHGAAYVIFGQAGGLDADISVADLDGTDGFRIVMPSPDAYLGSAVSLAGDINGDGLADLVVAADTDDAHGKNSGSAYVIFGSRQPFAADFSLSSLNGVTGFEIAGVGSSDLFGSGAASGDVNGDGYDDLIIGAKFAGLNKDGGNGAVYVIYGHPGGFPAHLDASALDGENGFRLDGVDHENAGRPVKMAGDINGDGFADMMIGARFWDAGATYVVFGSAEGPGASLSLGDLDGSNGFRMVGASGTYAGAVCSAAGDVNGDGFADMIVSCNGDREMAYVIFGHAGAFDPLLDLGSMTSDQGYMVISADQGRTLGHSVSSAGDVNGDGLDDLMVSTPAENNKGLYGAGAVYVIFSQLPDQAVDRVGTGVSQHLVGGDFNDALSGLGGDDLLMGNGGADTLSGGAGDDTINGGDGEDTVSFDGDIADYRITALGDGRGLFADLRNGAPEGVDQVNDVETFVFDDVILSASDLFRTLTMTGGVADDRLVEAGVGGSGVTTATASALGASDAIGSVAFDLSGWTQTGAKTYSHAGVYGVVILDIATGVVSYTLDNQDPDTQALAAGQGVVDDFVITLYDGRGGLGSTTVGFDIKGSNDAPTITGGGQVSTRLVEAGAGNAGVDAASATPILFDDPDAGDAASIVVKGWHRVGSSDSYIHAGAYGVATLDIDTGVVSYALDNADKDTQALNDGDVVTDSFVLSISDGHGSLVTKIVVFTIDGAYDSPAGTPGDDVLTGDAHDDLLDGGKGNDSIDGAAGDDTLFGSAGRDSLEGGDGADRLTGGLGADQLTGGLGRDVFAFDGVTDSWKKGIDLITDLTKTDVIDLSAIDADSGKAGDQAFHLVGAFSHNAGELTISYDTVSHLTTVRGDVDGDGKADLVISIAGNMHAFTGFVL